MQFRFRRNEFSNNLPFNSMLKFLDWSVKIKPIFWGWDGEKERDADTICNEKEREREKLLSEERDLRMREKRELLLEWRERI
jgi:hypothetical protein